MPKPETKLEETFTTLVRRAGGISEKVIPTRGGMPDRVVLFSGRIYLVELKTATGERRPDQIVWHDRAAAVGVPVWTLYGKEPIRQWVSMMARGVLEELAAEWDQSPPGFRDDGLDYLDPRIIGQERTRS